MILFEQSWLLLPLWWRHLRDQYPLCIVYGISLDQYPLCIVYGISLDTNTLGQLLSLPNSQPCWGHSMLVCKDDILVSTTWYPYGQTSPLPVFSRCTFPDPHTNGDHQDHSSGPYPIIYQEYMDIADTGVGYEDGFLQRASPPTHRGWFCDQAQLHGYTLISCATVCHWSDTYLFTSARG